MAISMNQKESTQKQTLLYCTLMSDSLINCGLAWSVSVTLLQLSASGIVKFHDDINEI